MCAGSRVLCETVKDFVAKVGTAGLDEEGDPDSITKKVGAETQQAEGNYSCHTSDTNNREFTGYIRPGKS